jgi:hypothetical protein
MFNFASPFQKLNNFSFSYNLNIIHQDFIILRWFCKGQIFVLCHLIHVYTSKIQEYRIWVFFVKKFLKVNLLIDSLMNIISITTSISLTSFLENFVNRDNLFSILLLKNVSLSLFENMF